MTLVIIVTKRTLYAARHNRKGGRRMSAARVPLTPRERMVRSAAVLMREHGVEAMSFSQVVEHSGAPRGSIYHYFPGGKAQLVEEATKWAGEFVRTRNGRAIEADGPLAALASVEQFWRQVL